MPNALQLDAPLLGLPLMGLAFGCPRQRPTHGAAKPEVTRGQQRLVQMGLHPFDCIPRRAVLELPTAQGANASNLRPTLVKATYEVAKRDEDRGLVTIRAERCRLVPPGRFEDSPGNVALLHAVP